MGAERIVPKSQQPGERQHRRFEFDGAQYRQASTHQVEWGEQLIADLCLKGDEKILDIGCGDGTLTKRLAQCVPDGHVLAIDSSEGMLDVARTMECSNISFLFMDVRESDFVNEFDVIFSNAALHWVMDHSALMDRLHRGLKQEGLLRVNFAADGNCATFFKHARQLIETDFADAFAGFEWPYFMPSIADYRAVLRDSAFSDARVWGENVDRYFPDEATMLRWLAQPAIVPFKQFVDAPTAGRFHSRIASLLSNEARRDDGTYFETFRRVNVLARK